MNWVEKCAFHCLSCYPEHSIYPASHHTQPQTGVTWGLVRITATDKSRVANVALQVDAKCTTQALLKLTGVIQGEAKVLNIDVRNAGYCEPNVRCPKGNVLACLSLEGPQLLIVTLVFDINNPYQGLLTLLVNDTAVSTVLSTAPQAIVTWDPALQTPGSLVIGNTSIVWTIKLLLTTANTDVVDGSVLFKSGQIFPDIKASFSPVGLTNFLSDGTAVEDIIGSFTASQAQNTTAEVVVTIQLNGSTNCFDFLTSLRVEVYADVYNVYCALAQAPPCPPH